MKKRFTITYDIVTKESSRNGDFAYNGYPNTPAGRAVAAAL